MDQESKVRLIELFKNLLVLWQPNHKSYGKRGPRSYLSTAAAKILILSDIFFSSMTTSSLYTLSHHVL